MEKQRIRYLLKLYIEKALSPSEEKELLQVIENTPPEYFEEIIEELIDAEEATPIPYEEWNSLISSSIKFDKPKKQKNVLKLIYRYAIAAAVLIITSIALYFYTGRKDIESELTAVHIQPGENKALLIMSNGNKVSLGAGFDSSKIYALDPKIASVSEGELIYAESGANAENIPTYNILKTPKGGQYSLILPDGTAVWLNSDSELKFPSHFTDDLREVELKGEAYFEVSSYKNKKWPFYVKSERQQVQVLGTKFNISAYGDEEFIKTSLLEGKVKVVSETSGAVRILKPGQEAALNRTSNNINVYNTEVEEAIAWKEGLFVFNNERVELAMNKIARWYDVEIVYKGNFADKAFWGTVSRSEKLETLLKTLQSTGVAKFKVEGRRIIVM